METKPVSAMIRSVGLVLLGASVALTATAAEVYRMVDEQGRVTYTDSPPQGKQAQKVEMKPANTLPPAAPTERPAEPEPDELDYQLQISYPPDDFHVNPGVRSLDVQVQVEPALAPKHQLQVLDNGAPLAGTRLENIVVRGTHLIQARIVAEDGQILAESEPIRIHVHRPSIAR